MTIGERISMRRKEMKISQMQLAQQMEVSFQAVSGWERNEYLPDTAKMIRLAQCLNTTVGCLLGETGEAFPAGGSGKLFEMEKMYTQLKAAANVKQYGQTLRALAYAKAAHEGQWRKGKGSVPYLAHPLMMACHALALGIDDDRLLAAILLHDVAEDCGVAAEELPVDAWVQQRVQLLTFRENEGESRAEAKRRYFEAIGRDAEASIIKTLDRCSNLSTMATGFSRERMKAYIEETQQYVLPLLEAAGRLEPKYCNAAFVLKYHMKSLLETIKQLL